MSTVPSTIASQILVEHIPRAEELFRLFREHNPHLRVLTVNAERPSPYWLCGRYSSSKAGRQLAPLIGAPGMARLAVDHGRPFRDKSVRGKESRIIVSHPYG